MENNFVLSIVVFDFEHSIEKLLRYLLIAVQGIQKLWTEQLFLLSSSASKNFLFKDVDFNKVNLLC